MKELLKALLQEEDRIREELRKGVPIKIGQKDWEDCTSPFSGDIENKKNKELECIPKNTEEYISFSLGGLRFINSLSFLPASLDSLAKNLSKETFELIKELADNVTGYDPDKPKSFIQCLDANNIAEGQVCMTVMPTEEKILAKKEQAKRGCIL